jgi:hypothetical protein
MASHTVVETIAIALGIVAVAVVATLLILAWVGSQWRYEVESWEPDEVGTDDL